MNRTVVRLRNRRRKRWEEMTFWERDAWIGRGLGIAWALIAFSLLLLYLSVVVAAFR